MGNDERRGYDPCGSPASGVQQWRGRVRVVRDGDAPITRLAAMIAGLPVDVQDETDAIQEYVDAHPGLSCPWRPIALVDERLRITEHPSITFREGPTGRRTGLVGGPDVWEVVRAIRSTRAAEPELDENALISLVAENVGLTTRLLRTALRYWAAYPDNVDAEITAADDAESAAELAWQREHDLLAG